MFFREIVWAPGRWSTVFAHWEWSVSRVCKLSEVNKPVHQHSYYTIDERSVSWVFRTLHSGSKINARNRGSEPYLAAKSLRKLNMVGMLGTKFNFTMKTIRFDNPRLFLEPRQSLGWRVLANWCPSARYILLWLTGVLFKDQLKFVNKQIKLKS